LLVADVPGRSVFHRGDAIAQVGGGATRVPLSLAGLIVCGPMLRRVDAKGLCVFVALKEARDVRLALYDGTGAGATALEKGTWVPAREFGASLRALAASLAPSAGLQPKRVYGYDVELRNPVSGQVDTLDSLGLLDGAFPLGYAKHERPGFALPSSDLGEVRLVHASCRLPSGEGPDVLPILDDIIASSRTSATDRPQLLLLTGDQIYADDVEPSLLYLAQTVGMQLLGWSGPEKIPGYQFANAVGDVEITQFFVWPGRRTLALTSMAGVTSTRASCHLLALAEFVGMYCLVWSPELWPWTGASVGLGGVAMPKAADIWPGAAWQDPANASIRKAAETELKTRQWRVKDLGTDTPKVRRALANVPTLMQMDDHEVTDDWNLTRAWCETVYATDMGRRLVQNALATYAVFQGWGNDPAAFDTGTPGDTLLTLIGSWTGDKTTADAIQTALGLPAKAQTAFGGTMRWDYEVDYDALDVIALDTRTHRGYASKSEDPDGKGAPALLGPGGISKQLLDRLTARQTAGRTVAATIVVAPAPVIGDPFVEGVVQPLINRTQTPSEAELEAWSFQKEHFQEILRALARFGHVVVLSGDIHHGFSSRVEYWNDRAGEEGRAVIVQLISSGLRNEDVKTRLVSRGKIDGVPRWVLDPTALFVLTPPFNSWVGWTGPGPHLANFGLIPSSLTAKPYVMGVPMGPAMEFARDPDWRYRVGFAVDQRPTKDRQQFPAGWPTVPQAPASDQNEELFSLAEEHRRRETYDEMRVIVGHNNLGDVLFGGSAQSRTLEHAFWFRPNPDEETVSGFPIWPVTVHKLKLEVPEATDPKPGIHNA
jgi:hypothetical protein